MGDISFGATIGMLEHAMDGASQTHGVIANNVANANTPHFHRSDVSFKEALAATDPKPADDGELKLATTSDRHLGGVDLTPQPFATDVTVDNTTQMRVDGSNVDVDQEMAKLSQNSSYAQTMAQMMQVQFQRMHEAIREQVI